MYRTPTLLRYLPAILMVFFFTSCQSQATKDKTGAKQVAAASSFDSTGAVLPAPYDTKSASLYSKVIGWPEGKTPAAPAGFTVTKYAGGMKSPRWIYVLPNGDVLVACANHVTSTPEKLNKALSSKARSVHTGESANIILLFRGMDKAGKPLKTDTFLSDLNQPFGMLQLGDYFYVGNTDGVVKFPYKQGQTRITAKGTKILDLPAGGYNQHWTRNLLSSADGKKIYVTVGSGSNVAEHGMANEYHRANILEINPDGSGVRVFASGIRNPIGMALAPATKTLWTAVNERDELGDELVPDYLTSVKDGGFYGWPYSYFGQNVDPRIKDEEKRPDLVKTAIVPDVALGSHTASIGLAFYGAKAFPAKYQGGAFIGQHGSWNRSVLSGYRVAFVPFKDGKPTGKPEDFLTGFIADNDGAKVYGRPVGVVVLADGSLLVADDVSDAIWRVAYTAQ